MQALSLAPQPRPVRALVADQGPDMGPEPRAVIGLQKMRAFVGDHGGYAYER